MKSRREFLLSTMMLLLFSTNIATRQESRRDGIFIDSGALKSSTSSVGATCYRRLRSDPRDMPLLRSWGIRWSVVDYKYSAPTELRNHYNFNITICCRAVSLRPWAAFSL